MVSTNHRVVCPPTTRKRKADVLGRVAESSSTSGRGASAGWVACPLCGRHSQKRYALGRGISAHLHAVHTPWKPGKAELRKRRRLLERQRAERKRSGHEGTSDEKEEPKPTSWEPTEKERTDWDERVLQICKDLEEKANEKDSEQEENEFLITGQDRSGKVSQNYRDSLPPFIKEAADGNLPNLQKMVDETENKHNKHAVWTMLDTTDRNGSTAEHWASGGGHLACLKFLCQTRKRVGETKKEDSQCHKPRRRRRRRDGKTSLHYAARNGCVECIDYLLDDHQCHVDEASGDGTTPLHMACYGGHPKTVVHLMNRGADPLHKNEWGCGSAHWVGMTKSTSFENVQETCRLLLEAGVSFVTAQKQGHTALHKAAQKQNRHVIEWMTKPQDEGGPGLGRKERALASQPDEGGHRPSEIWQSVGGNKAFADFIRENFEQDEP